MGVRDHDNQLNLATAHHLLLEVCTVDTIAGAIDGGRTHESR
jgi:hypothetical protein